MHLMLCTLAWMRRHSSFVGACGAGNIVEGMGPHAKPLCLI